MLADCKLTYFGLAGRGESIRLALHQGGIQFKDEHVSFAQWPAMKESTPFGQLPVLELKDGTVLSQQKAILRLVGKETGLYPKDSLVAAKVDMLMDAVDSLADTINDTGKGLEADAKLAARKEGCESGKIFAALTCLEAFINKHGKNGHSVGDSLTIADLLLAAATSFMVCGFYDGVTPAAFKPFKAVCAVRTTVGKLPAVTKYYESMTPEIKASWSETVTNMAKDF